MRAISCLACIVVFEASGLSKVHDLLSYPEFDYQIGIDIERGDHEKIQYAMKKYEQKINSMDFLLYPAKNPKRLIVLFTWVSRDKHYGMWSWFWNDEENWDSTAYLFLYDPTITWFLGKDGHSLVKTYSEIINQCIKKSNLGNEHVFTVGISMGGYAALYYATLLNLKGAIAICPQIDRASACTDQGLSWEIGRGIDRNFQDLDQFLANKVYTPAISLNLSGAGQDCLAAAKLIDAVKQKKSLLVFRKKAGSSHGALGVTRKFIEQEIDFLDRENFSCTETLCG